MTATAITPSLADAITDAVARRLRSTFSGGIASTSTVLKGETITVTAKNDLGRTYAASFPVEQGVVPIYKTSTQGITRALRLA